MASLVTRIEPVSVLFLRESHPSTFSHKLKHPLITTNAQTAQIQAVFRE